MAAIKSRGNRSTELRFLAGLRWHGITGWCRNSQVTGRPDFLFQKERVAVFIDGCFWHGCATHMRLPSANREYWKAKIEANRRRDRRVGAALRKLGWSVLRVWEHELKGPAFSRCFAKLERVLRRGRNIG